MGGHGALTLYLTTAKQYRSASAFAPISNPTKCPWGEKAFKGYLQGGVEEAKDRYDATELIAKSKDPVHILVDYVSKRAVHLSIGTHPAVFPGHCGQFLQTGTTFARKLPQSRPGRGLR